eukprot:TRINITY_DN1080_c0_g1_i1.p1 TRINITY_DN1080_c0_g1~~TRINITY_DN1080_c0_g1_i1.p1  ORF type:complete len:451 (+),score=79.36 TRINITY_DN1080_c0_g1_i1:1236-2588(+)
MDAVHAILAELDPKRTGRVELNQFVALARKRLIDESTITSFVSRYNFDGRGDLPFEPIEHESDRQTDNQVTMLSLPDDVLSVIFKQSEVSVMLRCLALVCKRFHCVVNESITAVDFRFSKEPADLLLYVLKRFPHVHDLILSDVRQDRNFYSDPKLQKLRNVLQVLQMYPRNVDMFTDLRLKQLTRDIPHIRSLDISSCRQTTDKSLKHIGLNCHFLERLYFRTEVQPGDPGRMNYFRFSARMHVMGVEPVSSITDVGLQYLANGCPALQVLSLHRCDDITDAGVISLARSCPHLNTLAIDWCGYHVTDVAIEALAQSCKHLEALNLAHLSALTDRSLLALAAGCPHLSIVIVTECNQMSDHGVCALATSCPNLVEVNVSGTQLTNTSLRALGDHCPRLHSLNVNYCAEVTDEGVLYVFEQCALTEVACDSLTDATRELLLAAHVKVDQL